MSYYVSLTIPANTPVSSPTIYNLAVSPCVIRKVRILFPSGCVDLVRVWLEYRATRLYPFNDSGYFTGNGFPIEFSPDTVIAEPPAVIAIKGYSLDDTYDHTVTVMLDVDFAGAQISAEGLAALLLQQGITVTEA